MAYFIKEVTKEVVDIAALHERIRLSAVMPCTRGERIRLVMSSKTKEAVKAEHTVCCLMPTVSTIKTADYFEGHPVDLNESLGFGEVILTNEL